MNPPSVKLRRAGVERVEDFFFMVGIWVYVSAFLRSRDAVRPRDALRGGCFGQETSRCRKNRFNCRARFGQAFFEALNVNRPARPRWNALSSTRWSGSCRTASPLMSCTFGGLSDIILRRNRPILSGKAVSLTNARLSVEAAVPAAIRDCAGDTPATTAHRAPKVLINTTATGEAPASVAAVASVTASAEP